jgi:hypothetical protein
VAPKRLRRRRGSTVEALNETHSALVGERQQLRAASADAEALERNRLEIVRCQWQLAQALLARHLPRRSTRSAA